MTSYWKQQRQPHCPLHQIYHSFLQEQLQNSMRPLTVKGRFDSKHPSWMPRKRVWGSIKETCAITLHDFGHVIPQDLCLEKLLSCCLWRQSKPNWTWLWTTCCGWPCLMHLPNSSLLSQCLGDCPLTNVFVVPSIVVPNFSQFFKPPISLVFVAIIAYCWNIIYIFLQSDILEGQRKCKGSSFFSYLFIRRRNNNTHRWGSKGWALEDVSHLT